MDIFNLNILKQHQAFIGPKLQTLSDKNEGYFPADNRLGDEVAMANAFTIMKGIMVFVYSIILVRILILYRTIIQAYMQRVLIVMWIFMMADFITKLLFTTITSDWD